MACGADQIARRRGNPRFRLSDLELAIHEVTSLQMDISEHLLQRLDDELDIIRGSRDLNFVQMYVADPDQQLGLVLNIQVVL
eukprot:5227866-Heterocapsa_arctica.AAC.1